MDNTPEQVDACNALDQWMMVKDGRVTRVNISKEAAREFGIYDGEEMTCYTCGKIISAAPKGAENPYLHYGICNECELDQEEER